jgi:hypothetical protein
LRRLARFIALPADERKLFLEAAILLLVVRLGLWIVPYRIVNRILEWGAPRSRGARGYDTLLVANAARAVRAMSRYVPKATCLTQALALRTLLGILGQPALLKIGVRKNAGSLEAHAWVESQGRVVLGGTRDLARYTALRAPAWTALP